MMSSARAGSRAVAADGFFDTIRRGYKFWQTWKKTYNGNYCGTYQHNV